MFEGEVDAGGEEGRGDDEAADLDIEASLVPGITVEQNSANVSCAVSVDVESVTMSRTYRLPRLDILYPKLP